ncbi:MAG: site-specific integrase [Magnetococcales bacterium]|nr:site-specific integrase [Magnetococcales bacterium]
MPKKSEGAFSENTVKAIRADSKKFSSWCFERGLSSLPAEPETVRSYVDWGAENYKPATVKRHLVSIAHLHRAADLTDPTKNKHRSFGRQENEPGQRHTTKAGQRFNHARCRTHPGQR